MDSNVIEDVSSDSMTEPSLGETKSEMQMKGSTTKTKKVKKKPKIEQEEQPSRKGKGKRKKTSKCWLHFTVIPGIDYASCNYCGTHIGCSSLKGTGALHNHLSRCKKAPANIDKKQKMIELDSKTVVGDDGVAYSVSIPCLWQFDEAVSRKALARMIIVDELPFAFVEHEGFRSFCNSLNPAFSVPSRTTVTRDCYTFFIEERKNLRALLSNLSSRISLTTDAWSSCQNLSYMCLTAHFVDDDWILHKRILNFCPLAGHSGKLIGKGVEKCLKDWGIKNIMTITVDNASSNDVVVEHLKRSINHWGASVLGGKYLHVRCVAHILNLVVKDGLKDMDKSIAKVRALVRYVRSSPSRLQKFKICVEEEKIESKSLVCLDVDTRWNSTYLMLVSAVKFKKAFDNLLLQDTSCFREMMKLPWGGVANDEDWKRVNHFLPILEVFYNGTLALSGSRYVTCDICVQQVFSIGLAISSLCNDEDEGIRNMAHRMKMKYDKYWGDVTNINHMLFVSMFLDPRHKMQLVEWVINKSYDEMKAQLLKLNVKMLIEELFKLYASSMPQPQVGKKTTSSTSSTTSTSFSESRKGSSIDLAKLLTSSFQSEMGHLNTNLNKSELDRYIAETIDVDHENFVLLSWWRENKMRYPILAKVARDVLAIPVTTVASESAFSIGGRVLDSFRTSLTSRMVEVLICTQDWQHIANTPVMIEENLGTLEEIEEEMKELQIEQPEFILDENYDD